MFDEYVVVVFVEVVTGAVVYLEEVELNDDVALLVDAIVVNDVVWVVDLALVLEPGLDVDAARELVVDPLPDVVVLLMPGTVLEVDPHTDAVLVFTVVLVSISVNVAVTVAARCCQLSPLASNLNTRFRNVLASDKGTKRTKN